MSEIEKAQEALDRIRNATCERKLKCECPRAASISDMELVLKGFQTLMEEKKLRQKIQIVADPAVDVVA